MITALIVFVIVVSILLIIFCRNRRGLNEVGFSAVFILIWFLLIGFLDLTIRVFKENEFDVYKAEREAFIQAVEYGRENGSTLENATITLKVVEYNEYLAAKQADNKHFLLDPYISDRFDTLKPIQ